MKTPQHWQNKNLLAYFLWPVSQLYLMGRSIHRWQRLKNQYWAGVPVISVGNITAGGAGKTPFVAALARHFAENGYQVAILSRGYGGKHTEPTQVTDTSTAIDVGDEPVMLHRQLAHLPVQVWVGRQRPAVAARAERSGATLLILDDGFQRDDIGRNVDIVILRGEHPFGNGYCLPAGPLRDPLPALKRAHFAVVMNPVEGTPKYFHTPAYRLKATLENEALKPLKNKNIIAFAGLAYPDKFFGQLEKNGLKILQKIAFADHHFYTEKDIQNLKNQANKNSATLVTTEKDFARLTKRQAENITAIPLHLSGDDWQNITAEIEKILR
ncbi:MAG: tetraacyldisaccharide 4'-kinase [Alphaproteobacteria bacterium]|nr:tetraacyldisaccharide 4'-kinase [Alphaproteobacteria bacterium]MDD9919897.1 tetraacyldisaccharide 4'-kinase [Alphaproteobacteria bacterium]